MAFGMRAYRSDGSLQFDANYMAYHLYAHQSVQTQSPTRTVSSPSTALIVANPSNDEIVALRSPYAFAPCSTVQINGTWYQVYQSQGPVGTTVEYFTFRRVAEFSQPSSFGFKTVDATGAMSFCSDARPLVIGGVVNGVGNSISLNSAKNYAAIIPSFGGREATTYSGNIQEDNSQKPPRYYYEYDRSGKIYGVSFNSSYNVGTISPVSFNDGSGNAYVANANSPRPADSVDYDIDMNGVMFADVTGL